MAEFPQNYFTDEKLHELDRLAAQNHPDLAPLAVERLIVYRDAYAEQAANRQPARMDGLRSIRTVGFLCAGGIATVTWMIDKPTAVITGGLFAGLVMLRDRRYRRQAEDAPDYRTTYLEKQIANAKANMQPGVEAGGDTLSL